MSNTAARFRRGKPPERNGLHGATVVLSLVLHLVGFGAAVGLPRLVPRRAPGDAVYMVDLVALPPGGPSGAPAAPQKAPPRSPPPLPKAAPPQPKPASPKPKPEKPIVVPERTAAKPPTAGKPEPKPETAKPVEPEPGSIPPGAAPAGATAPPESTPPSGGSGATGGVGVSIGGTGAAGSGASDEYTFYLSLLDRNIRRAWTQPIYTGLDLKTATVSLELSRTGRILNLELMTPSGYDPLDRSVLRAVRDAAPFPPFPHFLGLETLTVQIVFELDPGGLGAGSTGE